MENRKTEKNDILDALKTMVSVETGGSLFADYFPGGNDPNKTAIEIAIKALSNEKH